MGAKNAVIAGDYMGKRLISTLGTLQKEHRLRRGSRVGRRGPAGSGRAAGRWALR